MPPSPARFDSISRVVAPRTHRLPPIRIACDVTNPLLGENGATTIYGPQKGLRPEDRNRLEATIARMASSLCEQMNMPLSLLDLPGAGAAGGTGFGFMIAAGAKLVSGSDFIAEWLELDRRVAKADLILTGEGRFDATSLAGKGPGAVIRRAAAAGKPVRVLAGNHDLLATLDPLVELHRITPPNTKTADALAHCREFLVAKVDEIFA
jgi:glycerate kinase